MEPIADRLKDHGITLREYREGERRTLCPKCSHQRKKSKDTCLAVKIDGDGGATWFCHNCAWSDGLPGLDNQRRADSRPATYRKPKLPERRDQGDRLVEFFRSRGISEQVAKEAGCFLTTRRSGEETVGVIAFPYLLGGEVVNIKYRTFDKRFQQEKDARRTLYGIDYVDGDEIVFVEGELDVLACREAGIMNAVTMPDGAPQNTGEGKRFESLKSHADKLQAMKRIILAGDDDEKGHVWFNELAARFGKDRCYRVTWPSINDVFIKDANDCLLHHGPQVLRECLEMAERLPVEGLIRPSQLIGRLRSLYDGDYGHPVSTGFDVLDRIYRVLPGELTVVSGVPNGGKSNFFDQVMINLADREGWKFAVFSPEHSTERHLARLIEKRSRAPFYQGLTPQPPWEDVTANVDWLDEHFLFFDTARGPASVDWILDTARSAALRLGINGLLLDPWNELESTRDFRQSETDFVSENLSKIKAFGKAHDVAVWIVIHPKKMSKDKSGNYEIPSLYDLHGSAHWFNKPDNGLIIHRFFDKGETGVFVKKVREQPLCGQQGAAFFRFDKYDRTYYGLRCEIPGEDSQEVERIAAYQKQNRKFGV